MLAARSVKVQVNARKAFSGNAVTRKPQLRRPVTALAPARGVKVMAASYICIDCGYIYDNSEGPFEKLPSSYKCPACNAPKRRFKTWSGNGKNDPKSMKTRMTQLKAGGGATASSSSSGSDSSPLVIVGIGAAVLIGLYVGLNGYYN